MLLDIERDDAVLTLEGEVDASNADELARAIEPENLKGGLLALDLEGLSFLDVSGAHVLLDAAERLRGRGRLLLCRPRGPVRRVLDILRADRIDGMDVIPAEPHEVLRQRFVALAKLEPEALCEMLAEDAVWHVPGENPLSGEYKGRNEILGLAVRVKEFTGEYLLEIEDVLEGGDHVAIIANVWGDRSGRILFGARQVTTFHLEGGMVTAARVHAFDPGELDRFWR